MAIKCKTFRYSALIWLGIILLLCQKLHAYADSENYNDAVIDAIRNSEATNREWVASKLKTITGPGDGNVYVKVNGVNRVLGSTFTRESYFTQHFAGEDFKIPTGVQAFITLNNELKNYWSKNGITAANVSDETARVLGINIPAKNNAIVEYAVVPDNEHIQRPTKNPDVTGYSKSTFTLPVNNFVKPPGMSDQKFNQFTKFYENFKAKAYDVGSTSAFPFTQYGYTYRWGDGDSLAHIQGLSEFVLLDETDVRINGIYSLQSYLYTSANGSGNFKITGNLDTLWTGRTFQPRGNNVDICENSNVTGGEGILVSSTGYRINNYGKIFGPTATKFGITGTENVAILFQGAAPLSPNGDPVPNQNNIVYNTGLISSPGTAIRADSGNTIIYTKGGTIEGGDYAVKTSTGNDLLSITNSIIKGKIDLACGNDRIIINDPAVSKTQFVFNLDKTTPVIKNVENFEINDNIELAPVATGFIPDKQKYVFVEDTNLSIAAGKAVSVKQLTNMPMLKLVVVPSSSIYLVSQRDLHWYGNNADNKSFGSVLDYIAGIGGGNMSDVLFALDSSSDPAKNSSQLEATDQTGTYTSAFYSSSLFVDAFTERLRRMRMNQAYTVNNEPNFVLCQNLNTLYFDQKVGKYGEMFANGYGYMGTFSPDNGAPGYRSHAGGYISGIGARIGKSSYAGMLFGISHYNTKYDANSADLKNTAYRVGPYASLMLGSWNVDALFTYAYHNSSSSRSINFLSTNATARYGIHDFLGYTGLSRVFNITNGFRFYPSTGLQYFFLNRDAYTESGAGAANLTVNHNRFNSLLYRAGGGFMKDFKVKNVIIRPDVSASWWFECLNPNNGVPAAFTATPNTEFITPIGKFDRSMTRVGAGISVFSAKANFPASVFVRNDTIIGKHGVFDAITAGLRIAI